DVASHLLLPVCGLGCAERILARGPAHRYRLGRAPLGTTGRQMPHDVVVDLQHTRDLVERLGGCREGQQVVAALGLVVDLVGEPPASPDVVGAPRAAALLDELAYASDDLRLALLGEL